MPKHSFRTEGKSNTTRVFQWSRLKVQVEATQLILTQSKNLLLYITNQDWDQAVRHLYIQLQMLLLNPSKNDGIATTLIWSFLAYYQQRNPRGAGGIDGLLSNN